VPSYAVADLGTLGGPTSAAYGVNNDGKVVGAADTDANGDAHAFLYDTAMRDLSTLPGRTTSAARAINNKTNPDVSGESDTVILTVHYTHAYRKLNGIAMQDLGTLETGGVAGKSYGTGVNDLDKVSGKSNYDNGLSADFYAFLYDGSLHTLQGYNNSKSFGNAIDKRDWSQTKRSEGDQWLRQFLYDCRPTECQQ
jgi:probable HAF family extracellular repeat protein